MKRLVFIAAAALAAATSCQKETFESPEAQGDYIIKASAEGFASTRAAISDDGVFSWIDGEGIEVYNGSKFLPFYAQSSAASTTFSGTLSGTLQKCAFSPKGLNPSVDGTTLKVTLPSEYTWQEGQTNAAMIAEFNDISNGLTFAHLGGVVKIQLTGVPTTATKFTFTADKDITGEYTLTNDTDGKKIIAASTTNTGKNTVTINFKNETDGGTMDFYIPLPVGTYNQFKLGVYKADGNPVATVDGQEKDRTIARKSLWKFNPVKVGTVKADGEGTPQDVVVPESHNGTFNLPATTATVNVYLEGNTHALDIVYAYGDGGYPEDVNIICKGNIGNQDAGTGLTVNLPKSHVTVSGNAENTVIINSLNSSTSNTTLVLANTVKIAEKLTVAKGSATIGCEVKNVTVAKKAQDDTSEGEVNITLADGAKVTDSLSVSQGNVAIEKGAEVAAVDVKESVGETATVTVASGASITKELKVAQAKSVEIAGTVPTVTVAATATSPVVTVAATANIATKLEVAKGSVDVAQNATIDAVKVAATVSNVTIATAVKTVTVTAVAGASEETAAPVIWVTETGKVTEAVKDSTAASGTSSVTVVAAKGQATESGTVGDGQVKVVTDGSGSAKQNVVKTPLDFLKEKIENGGEITLEDNISGNFEVKNGKEVTINLNGKTIKNAEAANTFTVALGGKLTINGNGTVDNTANRCAAIHNNGTLVLSGGTYTRSAEDGTTTNSYYTILNHGDMTVNSGVEVENKGTFSSTIASGYDTWKAAGATKYVYESNTNHQYPTLTINGGTITGGKYNVKHNGNDNDNTLKIADGVEIAKAKINGTIVAYVASNDVLAKALADANVKEIKLGADININKENNGIELPAGREVTLDLNGKTLTSGERATANFRVYGVLTLCDNSSAKSGKIVCEEDYKNKDYGYGLIRATGENSKIIVKSGEINAVRTTPANNGNFAVALVEGGDFEMTGGKIEAGWYAVAGNGNDVTYNSEIKISGGELISDADYAIYLPHKGVTTITGGKVNGACGAVAIRRGTLNISGGEILSQNEGSTGNWTDGTGTLGNAALVVAANYGDCVVNISGGTFTSLKSAAVLDKPAGSYKAQISVTGGTFSDLSIADYIAENAKVNVKLNKDVTLTSPMVFGSKGSAITVDLNQKTLTGRTNITKGNVTFKNGKIAGGAEQALNVYGSPDSNAENYSVLTVEKDVEITADVYAVAIFAETYQSAKGYGVVANIGGTIKTTGDSKNGAIFVSGNLGKDLDSEFAVSKKNTVNITANVTSATDAALVVNGSATVNVNEGAVLTGNTAISIKRGKLVVNGGTITGNGACTSSPAANGNGAELSGSAVLATDTYSSMGPLSVEIKGGTFTSAAYTILNNSSCAFKISGGDFKSTLADDAIAVWARRGSIEITGGTFETSSNKEATLYVGTTFEILGKNRPTLTVSGENTVVKNTATGAYKWNSALAPLTVNMWNDLGNDSTRAYSPVSISGGTFYGNSPLQDDNVKSDYGMFLKSGYKVTSTGTNVWKVEAE